MFGYLTWIYADVSVLLQLTIFRASGLSQNSKAFDKVDILANVAQYYERNKMKAISYQSGNLITSMKTLVLK